VEIAAGLLRHPSSISVDGSEACETSPYVFERDGTFRSRPHHKQSPPLMGSYESVNGAVRSAFWERSAVCPKDPTHSPDRPQRTHGAAFPMATTCSPRRCFEPGLTDSENQQVPPQGIVLVRYR
jgi:hypothetical protein